MAWSQLWKNPQPLPVPHPSHSYFLEKSDHWEEGKKPVFLPLPVQPLLSFRQACVPGRGALVCLMGALWQRLGLQVSVTKATHTHQCLIHLY